MSAVATVALEPVLIVSDGIVLIVEHKGERFGLPVSEIRSGSSVRHPGDRGRLVLSREAAERFATA